MKQKILYCFIIFTITATLILTPISSAKAFGDIVMDLTTESATMFEKIKDFTMDKIIKTIVAQIVERILNDIKKWALNGFNGEPYFIMDFKGALLNAADNAAGELINEILQTPDDVFCPNFKSIMVGAELNMPFFPLRTTFSEKYACSLTDIIDNNFSWENFIQAGLVKNDIFGLYFAAQSELYSRQSQSLEAEKLQDTVNKGFYDQKECIEWSNPVGEQGPVPPVCLKWIYKTPGQVIADQLQKSLNTQYDWLINIDEVGELVDAFLNGAIYRLTMGLGLTNKIVSSSGAKVFENLNTSYRSNVKNFEERRKEIRDNVFQSVQKLGIGQGERKLKEDLVLEILPEIVTISTENLYQAKTSKEINYDKFEELRHYNPDYDICTYFKESLDNMKAALKKYPIRLDISWAPDKWASIIDVVKTLKITESPLYEGCIHEIDIDTDNDNACDVDNVYWSNDPNGDSIRTEDLKTGEKVYMVAEVFYCPKGGLIRLPWFEPRKNGKKEEDTYFSIRATHWLEGKQEGRYFKAVCDWTPDEEDAGNFTATAVTMTISKLDGTLSKDGTNPDLQKKTNPKTSCEIEENHSRDPGNYLCKGNNNGVYTRGRPDIYCKEKSTCTRATVVSPVNCQNVFCIHTKDASWQGTGKTFHFPKSEIEKSGICAYFGLEVPADGVNCSKDLADYGKTAWNIGNCSYYPQGGWQYDNKK